MSKVEIQTDARTWLRNRRKDELIQIIIANLDRIDLFADAPGDGRDGMPLRAEVRMGRLCLGIGITTLAFAFENGEGNNPFNQASGDYEQAHRVTNKLEFAEDTCKAMNDEGEDGSTPLTRFIDSMMDEAVNQGCMGILDLSDPDED